MNHAGKSGIDLTTSLVRNGDIQVLYGELIHPQILSVLGECGHGSRILVADGNYPFSTTLGPNAQLVSLNLSPGVVSCVQVLEAISSAIPIESISLMGKPANADANAESSELTMPPICEQYREVLSNCYSGEFKMLERFEFYRQARTNDHALTIATGETETYANILLTVGVVQS